MIKLKSLAGKKFGRWTAIRFDRIKRKHTYWIFRCDCGVERSVYTYDVFKRKSLSCGCLQRDTMKGLLLKHGFATHLYADGKRKKHRFYRIWQAMKSRCLYKSQKGYKRYGGRGIKVCIRWKKFNNFYRDMFCDYQIHCHKFGERDTTIDRIDSDDNYCPSNCRWATRQEQNVRL